MTYFGSKYERKEPRVIKARKLLQQKIGTGQIDPFKIKKMQEYLDNLRIDYDPIAEQYLKKIEDIVAALPESEYDRDYHLQEIVKPVMELKATGGMFNEHVISNISGTVLGFLEHIQKLDAGSLEIVQAHNVAIRTALRQDIRSLENHKAQDLITEINRA